MKICLLTDDEHAALGARLSGMEARRSVEATPEEHRKMWREAVEDPSIAVLILSESVYQSVADAAEAHRKTGNAPLLIRLPAYGQYFTDAPSPQAGFPQHAVGTREVSNG